MRPKGGVAESARHIGGDLEAPPDRRERAMAYVRPVGAATTGGSAMVLSGRE